MDERRKYKRQEKDFRVHYTCAKGPLIIESDTNTKDISAGGIRLPLDDTIATSDRVMVSLELPWRRRPLDAIARVVWTSPKTINSDVTLERECGLEFAWPGASEIEKEIIRA